MAERSGSNPSTETRQDGAALDTLAHEDAGGPTSGRRRDHAEDVAEALQGGAADLKSAALEHGRHFFEAAKDQAAGYADTRKDEIAQSVADIAESLRETSRQFGDRPSVKTFMGSAADGLDQIAGGLKQRTIADLFGEAESYARRSPVVVGAVAVAAGFVLARFIKASADGLSATAAARVSSRRDEALRRAPDMAS